MLGSEEGPRLREEPLAMALVAIVARSQSRLCCFLKAAYLHDVVIAEC